MEMASLKFKFENHCLQVPLLKLHPRVVVRAGRSYPLLSLVGRMGQLHLCQPHGRQQTADIPSLQGTSKAHGHTAGLRQENYFPSEYFPYKAMGTDTIC